MDPLNLLVMVVVGAIAGTLAARIVKGDNFGFVVNALLGIAGAIVGGYFFSLIGMTPGKHIVSMLSDTFGVDLPMNFVGMIVSATVGSVIILIISGFVKGRRGRR